MGADSQGVTDLSPIARASTGLDLGPLLDAQSVAVVGAVPLRAQAKLASKPVVNLQSYGFAGNIYPVNPKYDVVEGLPAYPSLSAIEAPVDCVMILRRADQVADTIREMGALGIPAAIVCSGGFAEVGPDGVRSQQQLADVALASGVALCGPNTNGVLNFHTGMVLGFHPLLDNDERVKAGDISIISHSGTVTGAVMARLQRMGAGFGYVVSAGNEAVLRAGDYMEHLAADSRTSTVVLYLEQIRDGERFRSACEKLRAAGKTIVALKAGASEDSARVAFGHTGALAGSHSAFLTAARGYGVAVAHGLEELVALTRMATDGRPTSRKIVGLSMSGGLNSLLADAVNRAGAEFCPLDDATIARLRDLVPIASPTNPFDVTGYTADRPEVLAAVLDVLKEGTNADELVFSLGLMPDTTWPEWAEACSAFAAKHNVRVSLYAAAGRTPGDGYGFFERAGIGVYDSLEPLLRALVSLDDGGAVHVQSNGPTASTAHRATLPGDVPGRRELLAEWELDYVPYAYVSSADEAVSAAADIGYPVAMKVASKGIAHKAKLGLVSLDVDSDEAARSAFARLEANFEGARKSVSGISGPILVEIQRMLPRGGLECFLGGTVDPTFGPIVSVGLGGGLVEAIGDVSSELAPFPVDDARRLIASNDALSSALSDSLDSEALAEIVSRFSHMLDDLAPLVEEIECNPVVVFERGALIVDDLWLADGG